MSLLLSWVLFPLVLAVLGASWGFLVERAAGTQLNDALLLPLGLAAALVVAGTLDAFTVTAGPRAGRRRWSDRRPAARLGGEGGGFGAGL